MSHDVDETKKSAEESSAKEIEGHSYDGITEYDNPMPRWWVWTFILTIVFSCGYYYYYSFGGGPTLTQELAVAMSEIEKLKAHQPVLDESEETLERAMAQGDIVTLGASAYSEKCAACHGQNLQGIIGPNLVDSYWLHGKGTRVDIVKVIRQGVGDKGMPPWEQILSKQEVYAVTAFILSKKGSQPENPKPPQGDLVQ